MSLDPTARLANVKDSVKKFVKDTIKKNSGIDVTFDKGLRSPFLPNRSIDRWVSIQFGQLKPYNVSELELFFFCCTRQDSEGFKLAQLRDTVLGYLTDTTQTDGLKRIPFYRSHISDPWTLIGSLVVTGVIELEDIVTEDETKVRQINVVVKWGAII